MKSRHCVQCGVYIKTTTNMGKHWVFKRLGGYIHNECLPNYNKHREAIAELRYKYHIQRLKLQRKKSTCKSEYFRNYYTKNYTRLRLKNRDNYLRNKERRKAYQLNWNVATGHRKFTLDETDEVYRVKVL